MRILLIILLVYSVFSTLRAQPTLTKDNFPDVGTGYDYWLMDTVGTLPGPSGTGVTWNFFGLNRLDTFNTQYYDVSTTFFAGEYPQANIAAEEKTNKNVTYYTKSDTNITTPGYVRASAEEKFKYSDEPVLLRFPFTYLDSYCDSMIGYGQHADFVLRKSNKLKTTHAGEERFRIGRICVTADGHGTLVLPDSSIYNNVLRIETIENIYDTIISFGGLLIQTDSANITTHTWYDATKDRPLFEIEYIDRLRNGFIQTYQRNVYWYDTVNTIIAGIDDSDTDIAVQVFPNPTNGPVTIRLNEPILSAWIISNTNGTFSPLKLKENNVGYTADLRNFAKGVYVLKIITTKGVATKMVVRL